MDVETLKVLLGRMTKTTWSVLQNQELREFAQIPPSYVKGRYQYLFEHKTLLKSVRNDYRKGEIREWLIRQALEFELVGMYRESYGCCESIAVIDRVLLNHSEEAPASDSPRALGKVSILETRHRATEYRRKVWDLAQDMGPSRPRIRLRTIKFW